MWREAPDFPQYAISKSGRIINQQTGIELTPMWNGSLYVILRKDGKGYSRSVRKLTLAAWPELKKG